jgi:cytochrome c553
MDGPDRSSDRLWRWFAISSFAFLLVLAVSPIKDYFREYRRYQASYRQLSLAKASTSKELRAAQNEAVGIRQIWIPALGDRVDRCETCHLGVENSKMTQEKQPFREHPVTPHTPGDINRFGCTSCHRGQGRATSRAEAHGEVSDWSSPLLPLRYTEASCGSCHRGLVVPEASLLSAGRTLIDRVGCLGCHKIAGWTDWRSGAPDLDGMAEKTHIEWLRAWLKHPRDLRPATWMPDFHLGDDEIEAVSAFLSMPPSSACPRETPIAARRSSARRGASPATPSRAAATAARQSSPVSARN